ncbi:zinc ribbon domain-containing protein [Acidocella aminolytica]
MANRKAPPTTVSKTCSCCGLVKAELALSQRIFKCEDYGFEAGRDLNAARNLENMAASFAVSACGKERSGAVRKPPRETSLDEAATGQQNCRIALISYGKVCVGFGKRRP